ncbi:hypothetical protein [Rodentibacter trehalosifermentans]|nr:hypothetical protein [Rodentibacter trehalosifermentans]
MPLSVVLSYYFDQIAGGENLYEFAPNVNGWIDPLGLRGVVRPNIYCRGSIQNLENYRYKNVSSNPNMVISRSRDNRYIHPIRSKIPFEMHKNEVNANTLEFLTGELKDWNIKMAGIKGRGVIISPKGIIGNKCNNINTPIFECRLYKKTACGLFDTLAAKICLDETIVYSSTKHQLVSPDTIVECKEMK